MNKKIDAFNNNKIKVPFVVPTINSSDKKEIMRALSSNLLTDGPNLRKFEKNFSSYTNSTFSIGVSNATSGLILSLKSLGITKNDEVISFYCNFKFVEFKQGSMISSKNVTPDPKKVCEEWKCGEMLNIKFKTENKKKIIFSEKDTTIIDPDGNKVFVNKARYKIIIKCSF